MSPTFKVDGIEQSSEQPSEAFNNYFLNITENLNIHIAKGNNPVSLLKKYYSSEFLPMQIVPIAGREVRSVISSLKSKNSFGYDGISTKILKLCGYQISKPHTFICNKNITVGVFPEQLKYAIVIPLHKKGDISNMANYRPILYYQCFRMFLKKQCIVD